MAKLYHHQWSALMAECESCKAGVTIVATWPLYVAQDGQVSSQGNAAHCPLCGGRLTGALFKSHNTTTKRPDRAALAVAADELRGIGRADEGSNGKA